MPKQKVVGAAIVRAGRVLAGCRAAADPLGGRWEFPGGKLDPGESEAAALIRECREELDVIVRVGALVGRRSISETLELAVCLAEIVHGEPRAGHSHQELRWLAADELDDVPWLDADRDLVPIVRRALTRVRG